MTVLERPWGMQHLGHGGLRFYGREAIHTLVDLLHGDPAYRWNFSRHILIWIDVYPRTTEARETLLEILADVDCQQVKENECGQE